MPCVKEDALVDEKIHQHSGGTAAAVDDVVDGCGRRKVSCNCKGVTNAAAASNGRQTHATSCRSAAGDGCLQSSAGGW